MVGDVKIFGTVGYNPALMANNLSLQQVCKVCRVTMDTDPEAAMIVHRSNGTTMKFIEYANALYYFDLLAYLPDSVSDPGSQSFAGYLFDQTI
jgi:hypothetical protein